jgi:hypothetical protein
MRRFPGRYMYLPADRACTVRFGPHMCGPTTRRMRRVEQQMPEERSWGIEAV